MVAIVSTQDLWVYGYIRACYPLQTCAFSIRSFTFLQSGKLEILQSLIQGTYKCCCMQYKMHVDILSN